MFVTSWSVLSFDLTNILKEDDIQCRYICLSNIFQPIRKQHNIRADVRKRTEYF